MPLNLHCLSFDTQLPTADPNDCTGPAYQGRSYPDQVDEFVAVISVGWTNASPVLPPPSRWTTDFGSPGLPPPPLPL